MHEKEIGKLEKMVIALDNESKNRREEKPMPEVSGGQNSDIVTKIIK